MNKIGGTSFNVPDHGLYGGPFVRLNADTTDGFTKAALAIYEDGSEWIICSTNKHSRWTDDTMSKWKELNDVNKESQ